MPQPLAPYSAPARPTEPAFKDGEFTQVPIFEDDIGAELLPILSKGLYTDPLHCVREYVQNAVDSGASKITIGITGNSVVVHDNGNGMSGTELIQARRFGVSNKNAREYVGFRGIGIYSGYDLCNRLLITTQQQGSSEAHVLEFDFGSMKKQLQKDSETGHRTSLADLLAQNTRFTREPATRGRKGTTVQLEDLSDFHIAQLRNRQRLRDYILRNLPIGFAEDFEHREAIVQQLKKEVSGYHAVRITLESDTERPEIVARPAIPDLDPPTMGTIADKEGNPIAFYWACLHSPGPDGKRGQLPSEWASYSGFVYKVKGFTIGDNSKLQRIFKHGSSTLYRWYTGEIYVTDAKVIPNTERDDFETNAAYETLQARVHDKLKELEKRAAKYQAEERAAERYKKHEERLKAMSHDVRAGAYDRPEFFSEVDDLVEELEAQRGKLSPANRDWGKKILSEAESLRERIKHEIENQPTAKTKKRAGRARAEETGTESETDDNQNGSSDILPRTLLTVVDETDIDLPEVTLRLLALIDESIAAVLGEDSNARAAILAEIEANLNREW